MRKPVVALVGRPNVGKSTLFNRLVGERLAITDETPGTTRDRLLAEADWSGHDFYIIDTGGIDPTKLRKQEPLSIGSVDFIDEIRAQAEIAVEDADVVIFVVDTVTGVTTADREVAEILRQKQKTINEIGHPPIIIAANKADSEKLRLNAFDFYELGLGEPFAISAIHGTGTGDLLDEVVKYFPSNEEEEEEDQSIKIAIVGKPNAGKSSLLNRIVGQERAIVSAIPGTTRDAIDTHLIWENIPITLIDTAGIRKRGAIQPGVEKYSVLRAFQAIERSDVALLVVDAISGITAQDTHIAGFINDAWKSAIVVVNKWDLVEKDSNTMVEYERGIRQDLNFMDFVPIVFISAMTGQRVQQVLPLAMRVQEERLVRLTTSQLNRILQQAQDRHQSPTTSGRPFRIYYGTQVRSEPPTFLIYCNDPELAHFTYMRFLENQIRREYPFIGTPIRLVLKKRERTERS